ncbi:hypothetical protein Tco_0581090 [Tanacetum coccineum]
MFDEFFKLPPSVDHHVPSVAAEEPVVSTGTPSSTIIDQDAPSTSTSQTNQESQSQVIPSGVKEENHDIEVAHIDNNPYFSLPIPELSFKESSSQIVIPNNVHSVNQPQEHIGKWTKDHQLENVIVEPKSYKDALTESCWIEAMLHELGMICFRHFYNLKSSPKEQLIPYCLSDVKAKTSYWIDIP